jgi:ribosomal protein S21
MKVKVRNGKVDAALRVFRRNSMEIIAEVRSRQYYVKPSDKRRAERKAGERRARKKNGK